MLALSSPLSSRYARIAEFFIKVILLRAHLYPLCSRFLYISRSDFLAWLSWLALGLFFLWLSLAWDNVLTEHVITFAAGIWLNRILFIKSIFLFQRGFHFILGTERSQSKKESNCHKHSLWQLPAALKFVLSVAIYLSGKYLNVHPNTTWISRRSWWWILSHVKKNYACPNIPLSILCCWSDVSDTREQSHCSANAGK